MKIIKVALFAMTIIAAFLFGFKFGIGEKDEIKYSENTICCPNDNPFHTRLQGYSPSCDELTDTGFTKIKKVGSDYITIHKTENYFHVYGIYIDSVKPPEVFWWGADRKSYMDQVCSE